MLGADLASQRGGGFSGEFMSAARSGLRLDLTFLKTFIPIGFTAGLGDDSFTPCSP